MSVKERREREKKQRRETILNAAIDVLNENGFIGFSMDKVADKAELSKGSLYLYFENKEKLIIGIFWRKMKELADSINKILNQDKPFEEILMEYIESALNFYRSEQGLFKLMLSAFSAVPHNVMEELRKSIKDFTNEQKETFVEFFSRFSDSDFKYEPIELFLILRGMITSLLMANFFGIYKKDVKPEVILDVFLKGVMK